MISRQICCQIRLRRMGLTAHVWPTGSMDIREDLRATYYVRASSAMHGISFIATLLAIAVLVTSSYGQDFSIPSGWRVSYDEARVVTVY